MNGEIVQCKVCNKQDRLSNCPRCRDCNKLYNNKRADKLRRANRLKLKAQNSKLEKHGKKVCSLCEYVKYISEFGTSLGGSKGKRNKICDQCLTKIYEGESRKKSSTEISYAFWRKRAYSANCNARSRLSRELRKPVALSELSYVCKPQHLAEKYCKQSGLCAYCSCNLTVDNIAAEHVIPLSRGGKHSKANIVLACHDCNRLKHTRTSCEFSTFLKEYVARFKQ